MSYQVLARKWRPKKFQDVVGQEHITRSLQNAIARDKLGHAYILTGTRGIGKTTVARIFAKAVRCENLAEDSNPCNVCNSCLDFDTENSMNVIEIDGASNNSVDDVRDLIGNVQYLPTSGKYKVYVIDEVHMLSTSAFNALLKTLEEPPAHALFIFATTEPDKLLGTILSRCQRFDFRNASLVDLVDHVNKIASSEGIEFESQEIVKQICAQGKGSFRDTLSLLDQVLSFSTDNKITEETITIALGLPKSSILKEILSSILIGDAQSCSKLYKQLLSENVSAKNIITALLDFMYVAIEKIDSPDLLYQRGFLKEGSLDNISAAEIFWIYETMAKDATWTLDSISPDKVSEVALQKLALRRDFFDKTLATPIDKNKKKSKINFSDVAEEFVTENITQEKASSLEVKENVSEEVPVPAEEPVSAVKEINFEAMGITVPEESNAHVVEEEVKEIITEEKVLDMTGFDKTWEGFLTYLHETSPASASNLEQGNIISPLHYNGDTVVLNLGFNKSGKVFLDYLRESESYSKLVSNIALFFNVEKDKVELSLEDVEDKEDFESRAQIEQRKEDEIIENKKEEFKNNPLVKKAEDIFQSKLEQVNVGRKK
jgi:DNA polymerase-3 subunit gamma/tau